MKNTKALLLCCAGVLCLGAAGVGYTIQSTSYTRQLLRAPDATTARGILGVTASGDVVLPGFNADQFTLIDTNIALSDGSKITNAVLSTPAIASFASAAHDHLNEAGGGNIPGEAIGSGTIPEARIASEITRDDEMTNAITAAIDDLDVSGLTNMPHLNVAATTRTYDLVVSNDVQVLAELDVVGELTGSSANIGTVESTLMVTSNLTASGTVSAGSGVFTNGVEILGSGTNSIPLPHHWDDGTNFVAGLLRFGGAVTNEGTLELLSIPVAEGQSVAARLLGSAGAYGQTMDVFADYPTGGALAISEAISNRALVTNWVVDVNSGNVRFKFIAEPSKSHYPTGIVEYAYGWSDLAYSIWDFEDGFEGTGFEETGWVETPGTGSIDEDDTQYAATGTQSLTLLGAATTYVTTGDVSSDGDWAIAGRVYITNEYGGNTVWLRVFDADGFGGALVTRFYDGTLKLTHGTVDAYTTGTVPIDDWVTVFVGIGKGSADDGILKLGFSTDGSKPTIGNPNYAAITTGTAYTNATRLRFYGYRATNSIWWDDVSIIDSGTYEDLPATY